MSALPSRTDISGTPSNATGKAALSAIFDFVAQRFAVGTSGAGTASTAELALARTSLGVREPGPQWPNASAQIAQRPTAPTITTSPLTGQCDNIRMWVSTGTTSAGTISQITSAISTTSGYAARAAGLSMASGAVLSQSIRMEARDAIKYKNKVCSFQVKVDHDAGANMNYTLVVKKPTVSNNFASRTTISTSSATAVVTGTGTTLTFANVSVGDVSLGMELEIQSTLASAAAIATKNFNVGEWGVEPATTASPWAAPDESSELRSCLRYQWITTAASAAGDYPRFSGNGGAGVAENYSIMFPVPMLAAPTVTILTGAGWAITNCAAPVSGGNPTPHGFVVQVVPTAAGAFDTYAGNSNNAFIARKELD